LATVADAAASAERRAILERPEMVASLRTVLSDDSKKARCFGLDGFGQSRVVVASLEHAPLPTAAAMWTVYSGAS
jgi:hypothetical protein